MLTVENIAIGSYHDVWNVNVEEEYHEESSGDDESPWSGRGGPAATRLSSRGSTTATTTR